jgi:DNA mismatch repair protein MutS
MEENHFIKRYIDYHNQYIKKYGDNTVVLIQTGSHFNLFAVINDEINEGPDIYHICQNILNITVSKQNKNKPGISYGNCLLAGFPIYSIQKYENILLDHNYTIVIIEQTTAPPNPERDVTRIVSPGTSIENYNKKDSHYLMSIYIEKNEYMNKDIYIVGISSIDLSTGKNYLHSVESKVDDTNYWNDEIERYINFYNPSEIIFQTDNYHLSEEQIIQNWDIDHNSIQINHYNDKGILKLSYQNDFLKKVFHCESLISPIEELDLERNNDLVISYIYLLQYINDHRADTLINIEKPEIMKDEKYLCLTSNSIRQLNIINNYSYFKGKNESLLSVCNFCVTPMGRRLFKERLLYPSINKGIIEERYNCIDLFKQDQFYEIIFKNLKKVSDLEKSLRKMGLGLLQPNEFFSDSLSFDYVEKVITSLQTNDNIYHKLNKNNLIKPFQDFYNDINNTFLFENFSPSGNIEKSILKTGIHLQLDEYDKLTDEYIEILLNIVKRLSQLLDNSVNNIKFDHDERYGWHLFCTNKRAITLKDRLSNINQNSIHVKDNSSNILYSFKKDDFSFKKKDKSSTIIELDIITNISKKLIIIQDKLNKLNKEQWSVIITNLYNKYNESLKTFYHFISVIDFYCSGAKLAVQNCYQRPEIIESDKSFFDAKDIRHPIVEKIHTDTEYITNDISLSNDNNDNNDNIDGILLFGTNACGKSTFMKAIGLNIIMAQAGLFVAASSFRFSPYTQIFTRILNNDNIFRSQSSFAVEIQELKGIMNRADSNSLVLGDELCSGTESISALSIIATGLNILCERKSSFVFTSHLHQLTSLDEIKDLKNMEVYHLKIDYDKEKDILIYDRKLEKGSGPSIYGLKVCEAMGLTNDFISFAKKIQNKLEKKNTSTKLSQYNKNIFMDECKICSEKENLETHHIKDQQFADKNNNIDHHHKNIKHNLVPLCRECHLKVTNHEIIVKGWKETSAGRELDWFVSEKKIGSKKKFSDKDIKQIKSLKEQNNHLSQTDFLKELELNHNIKTSNATIRKILNNQY